MKRKILRKTRIVTILSALVVFLTVYSLVLPAVTLTDDAATEDPGINTSETTNVAEVEKLSLNEETSSDVEIETTEQAEEDIQKEEVKEEKKVVENVSYPAVSFSDSLGDMIVYVEAPEGAFPENTQMQLKEVEDEAALVDSINSNLENKEVKAIKAVDITFIYNNEEFEPLKPIKVSMTSSFIESNKEDEQLLVHVDNDNNTNIVETTEVKEKDVEVINNVEEVQVLVENTDEINEITTDNTVAFESDAFSVYAVVYTVDFEYSLNGVVYAYNLAGGDSISLADLAEALNIIQGTKLENVDAFVEQVVNVSFSNENLVEVADEDGKWMLYSLRPFTSQESLTITMKNGDVITINVTDAQYVTEMNGLITSASLKLNGVEVEDGATIEARENTIFDLSVNFAENDDFQFSNDGVLTYKLPDGFVLTDGFETNVTIDLGIDGKLYRNKLTYDNNTNTVTLNLNKDDPNYGAFTASGTALINLQLNGHFDFTKSHVEFSPDLSVDVNRKDPHDANVNKTGSYDKETQTMTYRVTVTADGTVTDLNVSDHISGSALTYQSPSIRVAEDQRPASAGERTNQITWNEAGGGFDALIPDMVDGEVIVFEYKASVDPGKVSQSGNATFEEMGNTVKIHNDTVDKESTNVYHNIEVSNISKEALSVSEVIEEGDKKYQNVTWEIITNDPPTVSLAGSTITDTITGAMVSNTIYNDDITIHVFDSNGNEISGSPRTPSLSSLGVTDPQNQKTWTYTVPESDGKYKYVIQYSTKVDVTYVTGTSTAMNNVDGKGGNDTGTAPVGQNKGDPSGDDEPDDGISVSKQTLHVSESEVQWAIPISVEAKEGGYDSFVVTDIFPHNATGNEGFIDQLKVTDESSLKNNITVSGLHDGETYEVEYLPPYDDSAYRNSGKNTIPSGIKVTFYKVDGTPGLDADSSRVLTLRLTTLNDPDWLQYALDNSSDPNWSKHTNSGKANKHNFSYTAQPMKKVINKVLHESQAINYTYDGSDQPISVPRYEFRISVGGVNEEPLQIQDTFNTDLFMLLPDIVPVVAGGSHKTDLGNAKRNLVEGTDYSTVDGGINFDITDLPKDNGSYYGYYIIQYYLIPKSEEALSQIKMQAADNNGTAIFENTAALDDENKSTVEFDYKYKILDKTAVIQSGGYVDYTITINPDKMTLNNGEIMTLTDKYSKNQTIDFSTITVINTDPADKKKDVSWDFSGYTGQFKIPDETKVIIKYSAKPSESGEQTLTNEVYMNGYSDDSGESKVVSGDGGGSAGSLRIRLFKYESGHMEAGLNGARFRLLDANKQPIKDRNGNSIEFSTSEVYMYTADVPETDVFMEMHIAGKKKDVIETSPDVIAYIEANPWVIGQYVKKVSGYANVLVNEDTTGAYLKKDTRYYLEEIQTATTDPQGNSASYKYPTFLYSFMISDHPDYSQYIYSNNDVMTARNDRDNGGLDIVKLWGGSAELTDEQKNNIYFLIETKEGENWIPYTHGGVYQGGKIHYNQMDDDIVHLDNVPVGSYRVTECNASIDTYKLVTTYTVDGLDTEASTEFAFIRDDVDETPKTHNVTITNKYDVKGYEFTKIDSNTLQSLSGAKFTVKKQVGDSFVKEYISGNDGKFVIDNSEGKFEKDVLYYVEETTAPEGYTITDNSKYYFYFADSVNAQWDKTYNAINLITDGGRQTVGNEKGELSVTKNWVNAGNKPGSVSMTLKRYTMVDPVKTVKVTIFGNDSSNTITIPETKVPINSGIRVFWTDDWGASSSKDVTINGQSISDYGFNIDQWNSVNDYYGTTEIISLSTVDKDLDLQIETKHRINTSAGTYGVEVVGNSESGSGSTDKIRIDDDWSQQFSLNSSNEWKKSWKISDVLIGNDVLRKTDGNGNAYYYYVEEETLANFEVSYEPAQGIGLNVGEIIVTNTGNEPEKGSVKVTKSFSGIKSLPDGFKIINNINETEFTVANKDGGEGTSDDPYYWVIEDLDIGKEVQFTESGYSQDGYSVLINGKATASPETAAAAIELNESAVASFANVYTPLPGSLKITKSVTVDNVPTASGLADGTYVFEITDEDNKPATGKLNGVEIEDGKVSINIENGESTTIEVTDLVPGTYTIKEEIPTNGSELSGSNDIEVTVVAGKSGEATEAIASFINNVETTQIEVQKKWYDQNDQIDSETSDRTITFTLYQLIKDKEGNVVQASEYNQTEYTNSITGNRTVTISGLPKYGYYDGKRVEYVYDVLETLPEEYAEDYIAGREDNQTTEQGYQHLIMSNTPVSDYDEETNLLIQKVWNDVEGKPKANNSDKVKFVVRQASVSTDYVPLHFEDHTFAFISDPLPAQTYFVEKGSTFTCVALNSPSTPFSNRLFFTVNGEVVAGRTGDNEFTIDGPTTIVSSGWATVFSAVPSGTKGVDYFASSSDLINKYKPSSASDNDPTYIYTLSNSDLVSNPDAPGTASFVDSWNASITGLPLYTATAGKVYSYEVQEISVLVDGDPQKEEHITLTYNSEFDKETSSYYVNWQKTGSSDNTDTWVLTNQEKEKTEATAEKKWQNADGSTNAPEDVEVVFELYADGVSTGKVIRLNGIADVEENANGSQELIATSGNNADAYEFESWKAKWIDLIKYKYLEDGTKKEIQYTIKEQESPSGYNVSYGEDSAETAENGGIITNIQSSTSFEVLKVDSNGMSEPLEGARFELYKIDPVNRKHTGKPINPTTLGSNNKTGTDGIALFEHLADGYYEVIEAEMPIGYILVDDESFYIRIQDSVVSFVEQNETGEWVSRQNSGTSIFVPADTEKIAMLKLGNKAGSALPHTGGPGTTMIKLLGTTVMFAAIVSFINRKKRK